jgi:hypothetical protein
MEYHKELYDKKYNKQFDNSYCCFNHAIGLPRKHGIAKPLFDYEYLVFYYMFMRKWMSKDPDTGDESPQIGMKRVAWLKSRGLGGTSFYTRIMAWLCLRDNSLRNSMMAIITGPRITLAIDILNRMKNLFYNKLGIYFPYNNITLWLNRVRINAYPSHKLQAFRGQEVVSFIFFDEADFAPRNQQFQILSTALGYIPKSNPYMGFLSTPYEINGLMHTLEIEHDELSDEAMFKFLRTDYTWGINKVYTPNDIRVLQKNPNVFATEMRIEYGIGSGAIFTKEIKDMIAKFGEIYNFDPNILSPYTEKVMSVDPGYGDSYFGISIWEYMPESKNVRAVFAQRYLNLTYDEGLKISENLITEYNPVVCYVDASQKGFIGAIKDRIGEDHTEEWYQHVNKELKKQRDEVIKAGGKWKRVKYLEDYMRIIPFSYTNQKKELLSHMKTMCEIEGMVCINRDKFPDLFLEIDTARRLNKVLVKDKDNPMDLFETMMQALFYWEW